MHPIENIIGSSIERIQRMVDVNTVIGTPVQTAEKTMILPVSKVSVGFIVGGGEYGKMANAKKAACLVSDSKGEPENSDKRFPFASTTAVGMCLTPLSFVTVEEGNVRVLPAKQDCASDRLMDILPRVLKSLEKFMNVGVDCIKQKCSCNEKDSCGCQNETCNDSSCGCDGCDCTDIPEEKCGCPVNN